LQVAIIERSKTRHIVNLPDIMTACNAELAAAGREAACVALSFDGVEDFSGLLRELQTVDMLVSSLLLNLSIVSITVIIIVLNASPIAGIRCVAAALQYSSSRRSCPDLFCTSNVLVRAHVCPP